MNGRSDKNLKDLFEEFLGAEQANEAVDDVHKGEQILRKYPAPRPDEKLVRAIKLKIARPLLLRKASVIKGIACKAAAAAAVFIILVVICVKVFEKENAEPKGLVNASVISAMPVAAWESNDIAVGDAELAILSAEIEEVEREMLALQQGKNSGNGNKSMMELEIEFIEINSNFWKG